MGAEQSKQRTKLAEIDKEIMVIRSNLRASNRSLSKDRKSMIEKNLVRYSNEASGLKGKVKDKQLDYTQKNISDIMREVLSMDADLDNGAVETDSIVQITQNKTTLSLERPKNHKKTITNTKSLQSLDISPTLADIDNKFKTLKPQIKVSLQADDSTQLRVHQETLKVLATSLELIEVPDYTPLGDLKKKLDTAVTAYYQKINKALRDIRRNRDIKYLSEQQQKEGVMSELGKLRKEMEKYDSHLRKAFKAGDSYTIQNVHEDLQQIYERLLTIKGVDKSTKILKSEMEGRICWLQNYMSDARTGGQADLIKAQLEYEEIIKNIASGKSENTKEKLESLQYFTTSITAAESDDIKKRKQLLSNINDSLTTLNENQNHSNRNTVHFGDLNSNDNFEIGILNNFVTSWKILIDTFQNTNLSNETIRFVDLQLTAVENSISETRKLLQTLFKEKYKFENKLSASAPNLVEPEKTTSFLDTWNGVTETNETENNEPVQVRNKEKLRQEALRFSRINEIKTHVYYINEKFESSIQKPNLKSKLEGYIKTLGEYANSDNTVIAANACLLRAEIETIIRNINQKMSQDFEKLPIEYYTDLMKVVEENIIKLEATIRTNYREKNFNGYQDVKKLLNEGLEYLETINIPCEYDIANKKRLLLLQKIELIIDDCDKECFLREEAYLNEVRKTLNNLKEKIDRFSGPHKGVLYNTIEKELNKILINVHDNITNNQTADYIVKDTEKYLKILEHRATRDQSFRQAHKNVDNEKMYTLKEELKAIKNDIDSTPMNEVEIFVSLRSRLDLIKLGLDQLKNLEENIDNQKEIIYNEIETLKNVVEAKIALGQQDINQHSLEEFKQKTTEENDKHVADELDKIELTFEKLKVDILSFIGTKSDKRFYELDESTMRLIIKLDDLQPLKNTPNYERKVTLCQEIHNYEEILDKRTTETEFLTQFENDMKDIENNFSRYTKSITDLEKLAEKVSILKLNLEEKKLSTPLRNRRQSCIERMNDMEKNIKTKTEQTNLVEENLILVQHNLETLKANIEKSDNSVNDLRKEFNIIKTHLEDMNDLNGSSEQTRKGLLLETKNLEETFQKKNKVKIETKLAEIEDNMMRLKNDIQLFKGTTNDAKYHTIIDIIHGLKFQVDQIKLEEEDYLSNKRTEQLSTDLSEYLTLLNKYTRDSEVIAKFEQDTSNMKKSNVSVDDIREKLEEIQNSKFGNDFLERQKSCIKALIKLSEEKTGVTLQLPILENKLSNIENEIEKFDVGSSDNVSKEIDENLQQVTKHLRDMQTSDSNNDQHKNELLERVEHAVGNMANKISENKIYGDFIQQIDLIKGEITNATNRDVMLKIQNKLKYMQTDVEKAALKEKLKNEIHLKCTFLLQIYSDKMNSLPVTNYIGSADFLKDLETNFNSTSKTSKKSFEEKWEHLNKSIDNMRLRVEEFAGNENNDEYQKLEEELLQTNVLVKKLRDSNSTEAKKKIELKEKIIHSLTMLDEKVQNFETLSEVRDELEGININGNVSEKQRQQLDEQIISLQLKLGKLNNLNKSYSETKTALIRKMETLMNAIKQKESDSHSDDSGTSI